MGKGIRNHPSTINGTPVVCCRVWNGEAAVSEMLLSLFPLGATLAFHFDFLLSWKWMESAGSPLDSQCLINKWMQCALSMLMCYSNRQLYYFFSTCECPKPCSNTEYSYWYRTVSWLKDIASSTALLLFVRIAEDDLTVGRWVLSTSQLPWLPWHHWS